VRPQVNGIVRKRLFTEGGDVKAGQVLYDLDDRLYKAAYESAEANLQRALATLQAAELAAKRSADLVRIDAVSAQDNDNAIAALGAGAKPMSRRRRRRSTALPYNARIRASSRPSAAASASRA
jgi:membrane fusion protein, multidrug efflux system